MKIKIVSDGTVEGTKIINLVTGERLENITAIYWTGDAAKGEVIAHINVAAVPVELIGEVKDAKLPAPTA